MKANELVQALAVKGVQTTEQDLIELFGDVSHLTDGDVEGIATLFESNPVTPAAAGQMGQMVKLDASNLPAVADVPTGQIAMILQAIEADPASQSDEGLIQFYWDLSERQKQLTAMSQAVSDVLAANGNRLASALGRLQSQTTDSLQGMQMANQVLAEIAGGAGLGAHFRKQSDTLREFSKSFAAQASADGQRD